MVGQACYKHTSYRANREHFWYEVDLTASLGLVCLPEDYLVLWVTEICTSAHERYIELLPLVEQLCCFDATFYFSLTDKLEGISLINAETLGRSNDEMITACIKGYRSDFKIVLQGCIICSSATSLLR